MSSSEPEPAKTKTIQEVLKGSYWEQFSGDRDFISAVHHYYAVVQKHYSEPFYYESMAKLQSECERVDAVKSSDGEDVTLVSVTPLLEIISKAAVNERDTIVTFPDGKTGDDLYAEYVARNYYKSGEGRRAALKESHNNRPENGRPEDAFFR